MRRSVILVAIFLMLFFGLTQTVFAIKDIIVENINPDRTESVNSQRMAEIGDVTLLMYKTYNNANVTEFYLPWAYFRNAISGQISHVYLPAWGETPALKSLSELWASNSQISRYSLMGSPLPTSATFVSARTIDVEDLIKLKSGRLLAVYYIGYSGKGYTDVYFTYTNMSGDWVTLPAQRVNWAGWAVPAVFIRMAQHPVDGSIWAFLNRDGSGIMMAIHLSENESGVKIDWVNENFVQGKDAPDGEEPGLVAIPDNFRNKIWLAYPNQRVEYMGQSGKSCQVSVIEISADGSKRVINYPHYMDYLSFPAMVAGPDKIWLGYDEQNSSIGYGKYINSYDYSSGTWGTPMRLGYSAYHSLVAYGASREEFAIGKTDGKLHFYTDLNYHPKTTNTQPDKPIVWFSINYDRSLNCYVDSLIDSDWDKMNVTVKWYRNDSLRLTLPFNNNYATFDSFMSVLSSGNVSPSDVWKCSVGLYDGTAFSDWGNSSAITIPGYINRIPDVPKVNLTSTNGTFYDDEDLNCSAIVSDPDGDKLDVTFYLIKNNYPDLTLTKYFYNVTNGSLLTRIVKAGNTSVWNTWACMVKVRDGGGLENVGKSADIRILPVPVCNANRPNSPNPVITLHSMSPLKFNCSSFITHPDGLQMNVNVKLYKNGSDCVGISGGRCINPGWNYIQPSGTTFVASIDLSQINGNTSIGDVWQCSLLLANYNNQNCTTGPAFSSGLTITAAPQTCSDGTLYGQCSVTKPKYCDNGNLVDRCGAPNNCGCPGGQSCNATNNSCYTPVTPPTNSPPNNPNPQLSSTMGTNTTKENLTCSSTVTDPDGDRMNVTVRWYKNNAISLVSFYNNSASGTAFSTLLASGNLSIGDRWMCSMMLNDSRLNSSWVSSNTITILAPPSQTCSDGTGYGQCALDLPKYCSNGALIDNCTKCGCASGYSCNSTNNSCYLPPGTPTCADGTPYGNCSVNQPAYCDGGTLVDYCSNCGCPSGYSCETATESCFASGGGNGGGGGGGGGGSGGGGGGTPSGNQSQPPQQNASCTNKLEISMPDDIFIPQRVSKQVSVTVRNAGNCTIPSLAAVMFLPAGWSANSYMLNEGLAVGESRVIEITILPSDLPAGEYSATLKLDAPAFSVSKTVKAWLVENPPYVVSEEGVSVSKVFEYIIALILIEFVFGAAVMILWYKPPQEKLPPLPQISDNMLRV